MKEDPKWNIGSSCVQDHEHTVNNYYYTTTVVNVTPFNVPKIGDEVEVVLDRVFSVLVGSVLWNSNIGSLLVKSFDKETNSVVITSDNVLVNFGKAVLANTEFIIGIPDYDLPTEEDYLNSPYLAADFISPGVCPTELPTGKTKADYSQRASVTTTTGIKTTTGTYVSNISLAGYVYEVVSILDATTILLCNNGNGADKGTIIKWDPKECGKKTVPVITYSTNPCEETPVQTGQIVVCNNGELTTIKGDTDKQMLIWNANVTPNRWELVTTNYDETCTYLTAGVTIGTGCTEEAPATIQVAKADIFNPGDKIVISDGTTSTEYKVKEKVSTSSSTQMNIYPVETLTETAIYVIGTQVCIEECCKWVPETIHDTIEDDKWRPNSLSSYVYYATSTSGVVAHDAIAIGNTMEDSVSVTATNSSTEYPLNLLIRCYTIFNGKIDGDSSDTKRISLTSKDNITITVSGETDPAYNKDKTTYELRYIGAGTNERLNMVCVHEYRYTLPKLDEDDPDASTATIVGTLSVTNESGSGLPVSAGTVSNHEVTLIVQGDYNE